MNEENNNKISINLKNNNQLLFIEILFLIMLGPKVLLNKDPGNDPTAKPAK